VSKRPREYWEQRRRERHSSRSRASLVAFFTFPPLRRQPRRLLISLKRGARALFLLGAGFHTNKIILLYHNRDVFTAAFTYVRRSLNFSP